jgi:uncharacterized membrane protein YfcA
MLELFHPMSPLLLAAACGIAALAGAVKGLVGFAMPMVFIAGLSLFLPPEWALAGLILPTLVTNGFQALGQGVAAMLSSVRRFAVFLCVGGVCLMISAQLVRILPASAFYLMLGVPVVGFAVSQLIGVSFRLRPGRRIEAAVGALAGFIGGFSGVWGPPTVAYLTAIGTPKEVQMRIQGVIYGLGAVGLTLAHLGSGVLRGETLPFSAALILPATLGMWVGAKLRARADQAMFRRMTLIVLLVAGANLIRRGIT